MVDKAVCLIDGEGLGAARRGRGRQDRMTTSGLGGASAPASEHFPLPYSRYKLWVDTCSGDVRGLTSVSKLCMAKMAKTIF